MFVHTYRYIIHTIQSVKCACFFILCFVCMLFYTILLYPVCTETSMIFFSALHFFFVSIIKNLLSKKYNHFHFSLSLVHTMPATYHHCWLRLFKENGNINEVATLHDLTLHYCRSTSIQSTSETPGDYEELQSRTVRRRVPQIHDIALTWCLTV